MIQSVNVLLIEDHAVYRETISRALSKHSYYTCSGQFSTMEEALDEIAEGLEADVILVDLGLPGMDGTTGIPRLRELLPKAKVIVLTSMTTRGHVYAAVEAGAHGYLIKSATASRVLSTLDEVVDGGTAIDPKVAGMLLDSFKKLRPPAPIEEQLSPREHQVLLLIARGLPKKGVAAELGLSVHSVTEYLRRCFDKLHVQSLPAAVGEAIRRGLLDFSDKTKK
jgi:DNA-binding NarL/FixJ family response regulator